jgi:hypothetical protein
VARPVFQGKPLPPAQGGGRAHQGQPYWIGLYRQDLSERRLAGRAGPRHVVGGNAPSAPLVTPQERRVSMRQSPIRCTAGSFIALAVLLLLSAQPARPAAATPGEPAARPPSGARRSSPSPAASTSAAASCTSNAVAWTARPSSSSRATATAPTSGARTSATPRRRARWSCPASPPSPASAPTTARGRSCSRAS